MDWPANFNLFLQKLPKWGNAGASIIWILEIVDRGCQNEVPTPNSSQKLKIHSPTYLFFIGCLYAEREFHFLQISITKKLREILCSTPHFGNQILSIEDKHFFFLFLWEKCITPNDWKIGCTENENKFPVYCRFLLFHKAILNGQNLEFWKINITFQMTNHPHHVQKYTNTPDFCK